MRKFILPDDFNPDFSKWYTVNERPFLVSVQNMGLITEGATAPVYRWHFSLHMGVNADTLIESGYFHWDPSDRKLTDENVANHLATFYGESEQVKAGKPLPDPTEMDELVLKCAAYMFSILVTEPGISNYNIITAERNDDGWHVVLNIDSMPARMFEFKYKKKLNKVTVSTYINAHTFYTEL